MYLSEQLQKKWEGVLDHADLPKIADPYRKAVTAVILENQAQEMAKAAGGWAASLSASVRPVVTYWIMALWSFIHIWFAWNAWLAGASPEVVFKTMMTVDFCALVSGTINFWFLDRTLKQRGL